MHSQNSKVCILSSIFARMHLLAITLCFIECFNLCIGNCMWNPWNFHFVLATHHIWSHLGKASDGVWYWHLTRNSISFWSRNFATHIISFMKYTHAARTHIHATTKRGRDAWLNLYLLMFKQFSRDQTDISAARWL